MFFYGRIRDRHVFVPLTLSLFLRPETLKEQTLNRGPSSVVKLLVGIGYTSRFTILWPRTKIRIEKDSLSVRHRSVLQHFYISKWKSRLVKLYNIVWFIVEDFRLDGASVKTCVRRKIQSEWDCDNWGEKRKKRGKKEKSNKSRKREESKLEVGSRRDGRIWQEGSKKRG